MEFKSAFISCKIKDNTFFNLCFSLNHQNLVQANDSNNKFWQMSVCLNLHLIVIR